MTRPNQRSTTQRLDQALVARGLMQTRAQAQAAIAAGTVTIDGMPAKKPSQPVGEHAKLNAAPAHPYVSRAGLKLAHGLEAFQLNPSGQICLDIGASTGGFSQVLLQNGAQHVFAVDVGRDQLHPTLKADPRVTDLSPLDARALSAEHLQVVEHLHSKSDIAPPSVLVCDASFIGLVKVIANPSGLCASTAQAVVLFKPQFEVGPANIGRGGIVRDTAAIETSLAATLNELRLMGWQCAGQTQSPIRGGDGNTEILLHLQRMPLRRGKAASLQ